MWGHKSKHFSSKKYNVVAPMGCNHSNVVDNQQITIITLPFCWACCQ